MIFITAKFAIKPEHAEAWPEISRAFTEAFRDGDAGAAHVGSDHFKAAQAELPPYLASTPKIISQTVDQDDWSELGELAVD